MSGTSNLGDLKARIAERQREERRRIEELEAASARRMREHGEWLEGELRKLRAAESKLLRQHGERWRRSASAALSTIERDTAAALERKDAMLKKSWLRSVAVGALRGLILFSGITLGIAGLVRWLAGDIQGKIETRFALAAQIEDQRRTVQQLEARTWGISLREMSNGKFVILPRGTLEDSRWTVEGKPAVRLSSR